MSTQALFVYGTLRADAPNALRTPAEITRRFKSARLIGRGTVSGSLYWASWYPGLLETRGPNRVVGDVFEFEDDPTFFAKLDAYEDASVELSRKREYQRKRKLVTLRGGRKLYAWTYVYNHPDKLGERIESGDFLREAAPA